MVCPNCGTPIPLDNNLCPVCYTRCEPQEPTTPELPAATVTKTKSGGGFWEAVKLYFINGLDFSGRATRSQFWWGALFSIVLLLIINQIPLLNIIGTLILGICGLSLSVRRLHDVGKSATWLLFLLLPGLGHLILLILYCSPSK